MVRLRGQRGQRHVQRRRQAGVPGVRNQIAQQGVAVGRARHPAIGGRKRQAIKEKLRAFKQKVGVGQGLGIQNAVHVAGQHRADSVLHDNL
ncbi:hypothetical protein D3C71_2039470 [compost metagenome]